MTRPALIGAAALLLAGCGGTSAGDEGTQVLTSFYPLEFVTARVGGDRIEVSSLTPPGAEPHDLELTPSDVVGISEADLVVVLQGFQPAVDDAVEQQAPDTGLDVAAVADLRPGDPHFWLDPARLADVADAVAERLTEVDPEGAPTFRDNADALRSDLEALDDEMTAGLAACESTDLVTSHDAFGYLARRYGLTQVGIAGLSPDAEARPGALAEVADHVSERGVTTIFTEPLVSPEIAEAVADETGAATDVLDPLEGLTADSAGDGYLEVMRANLEVLRDGLRCS
ncbi:MAG TPA: metal ABC transporter substrate-binding protein [Actinomycetales bacterium]|nr:metal ABC transporter substrate-binding protein [Actinomycetales bacterium]